MDLVIASNNAHKIQEIRQILGDRFVLHTLADCGIDVDVEETGSTFLDNALLKAKEICRLSGGVTLADDTGLCVQALGGAPGVYSARYAGEGHDSAANRAKLLHELAAYPDAADRKAYFCTVMVLYYPDGHYLVGTGKVEGRILTEEVGEGGFGYDSLFYSDELGCSFAQCSAEAKNSVSHRGRALADLVRQL